jgi:hypothetical protein
MYPELTMLNQTLETIFHDSRKVHRTGRVMLVYRELLRFLVVELQF